MMNSIGCFIWILNSFYLFIFATLFSIETKEFQKKAKVTPFLPKYPKTLSVVVADNHKT